MEAVVWFLVGALASLVGAAAGTLANGWAAWLAAVACGAIATALAKRLPVFAGSALVCAIPGARVADDARMAVGVALATVVALLAGPYGFAWLRGRVRATRPPQSTAPSASFAGAEGSDPSGTRLTDARLASLVRLAAVDTDAFRSEAAALSPDQRQQVREALLADR